jgi:flagellar M-ring protein FliF
VAGLPTLDKAQASQMLAGLLAKLPSASQMGVVFGLAAALALGVGMVMWALRPEYSPLFTNLPDRDVIQIADELRTQSIPFEIDKNTGLILVPNERMREVRMKLAANGLPRSADLGLEMLQQDQRLGTSQFMESARYQHALETELSRTVSGMRNVEHARVHLAIPKQSVFVRNRAKPSASVMVKLFPGRSLEAGQVDAIVHLVASSVPYMESSEVTVVDQWGRLLTANEFKSAMNLTQQEFEYTRKLEESYEQRIEDLLTPIVGAGAVKAKVSAELEFAQAEQTQEEFQPDRKQVRSEQTQDQKTLGPLGAVGVPGALSNQPPGAGTTQPEKKAESDNTQPSNQSKSTTRNYELDKTIMHKRLAKGNIKRLSVAVIVDDRVKVKKNGETIREPLDQKEIDLLSNLVREAVGFNEQRKDTVFVSNRSFQAQHAIEPAEEPPLWEQAWFGTLMKQLLAATVVLLVLFAIVRPALRSLAPSRSKAEPNKGAVAGDVADDKLSLSARGPDHLPAPPQVYGDILNLARAMASEDPKRVAKVIKNWVGTDA